MGQYFKAYAPESRQTIEHSYSSNFGLSHANKCHSMEPAEVLEILKEVSASSGLDIDCIMLIGDENHALWYDSEDGLQTATDDSEEGVLEEIRRSVWSIN